jgi:hypothetical protein
MGKAVFQVAINLQQMELALVRRQGSQSHPTKQIFIPQTQTQLYDVAARLADPSESSLTLSVTITNSWQTFPASTAGKFGKSARCNFFFF